MTLCSLVSCASPGPESRQGLLPALETALRLRTAHYTNPWRGELERVELSRIDGESDLYVALFDWEARWWGDFVVFRAKGDELQWIATVDEDDVPGAYGVSARGFLPPGFTAPLVEVLWASHMGNGALHVYELRDRHLRLVLETTAVDFHAGDGEVYRRGTLSRSYEDVDGDGVVDLTLTGFVDTVEFPKNTILASRPFRQTFIWDSSRRVFERRSD